MNDTVTTFKHEVNGESSRVRLTFIDPNDMRKGIRAEFDPRLSIIQDGISFPSVELTWKDLAHWFHQWNALQNMKDVYSNSGFILTPEKEK